ncbi:HAD-IA family hydrolase [Vibrio sp. Makdt]|uniref:HAD-IA family hydrolase n=1 Tax=Vibrio TaxID=662 RepID=UPI0022CD2676|nr:HAD-IA family hydrolase [Vibrio sp. Makdt]MDA0153637.1 HAD-IA family hydrolase [Vibrio sp. Makdt]
MIECKKFIFDVDATLVDTQVVIDNIWKKWCKTVGVRFETMSEYIHGRKIEETLSCIGMEFSNVTEVNKVKAIATQEMKRAKAIPNSHDFLSKLGPDCWSIATSGPRAVATTSLEASGFTLPKVMICAEDVVRGKPAPDPFLKAAEALGAKTEDCVAVEDSPSGVLSAKKAGCFTIALLTSHTREELNQADLIVNGFDELILTRSQIGTYQIHLAN